MSFLAAAIPVVASVAGGLLSSSASKSAANKAADAQTQSTDKQIALQRDMYNQNREDFTPYRNLGAMAAEKLARRLGMTSYMGSELGLASARTSSGADTTGGDGNLVPYASPTGLYGSPNKMTNKTAEDYLKSIGITTPVKNVVNTNPNSLNNLTMDQYDRLTRTSPGASMEGYDIFKRSRSMAGQSEPTIDEYLSSVEETNSRAV
jgi:hypothetical protein